MSGTIQTVKAQVDHPDLQVGEPVTTCDAREVFGYITDCLSTGKRGFMMQCDSSNDPRFEVVGGEQVMLSSWLVSYLDTRDVENVYIKYDDKLHEYSYWELKTGKKISFEDDEVTNANDVWMEDDWNVSVTR